jgi:phage I-like protein
MSGQKANRALMVARGVGAEIAFNASGGAAEWIMLIPAGTGGIIETVDDRGPYRIADPAKLAADSLQAARGRLPIDENHATDLAAPNGGPSPARGWAIELQARHDGIYGRVEWSVPGADLMSQKAYRYISPVFTHDKAGNVTGLLRASLTNTPNLIGMNALNAQENTMDLLTQLRKILGLADDADEAAVIEKIKAWKDDTNKVATAAALSSIAKAVGLKENADTATVLNSVTTLKADGVAMLSIAKAVGLKEGAGAPAICAAVEKLAAGVPDNVKALQNDLTDTTNKLAVLMSTTAKDKATAFIDGEIAKGRVIARTMRDHYISRHSASAEGAADVIKEVSSLPIIAPGELLGSQTPPGDGPNASNPVALAAAATTYQKKQAEAGVTVDYATAVSFVASQGAK